MYKDERYLGLTDPKPRTSLYKQPVRISQGIWRSAATGAARKATCGNQVFSGDATGPAACLATTERRHYWPSGQQSSGGGGVGLHPLEPGSARHSMNGRSSVGTQPSPQHDSPLPQQSAGGGGVALQPQVPISATQAGSLLSGMQPLP